MRRIGAHTGNRENHNNRTEFKKIALNFDLRKGEQHSSSVTHFRDPEPSTLFRTVCEGLKSFFHYIEDYSPSLNRIEREIKSSCTFLYKN